MALNPLAQRHQRPDPRPADLALLEPVATGCQVRLVFKTVPFCEGLRPGWRRCFPMARASRLSHGRVKPILGRSMMERGQAVAQGLGQQGLGSVRKLDGVADGQGRFHQPVVEKRAPAPQAHGPWTFGRCPAAAHAACRCASLRGRSGSIREGRGPVNGPDECRHHWATLSGTEAIGTAVARLLRARRAG